MRTHPLNRPPLTLQQARAQRPGKRYSVTVPIGKPKPAVPLPRIEGTDDDRLPLVVIDAGHGGIDTGAVVLAEAGLLDGHRATVHWEALEAFKERYPSLQATQELFEIDGKRITSAGGTSSLDLMLGLISQAHGEPLAVQVSEQFVVSRIRTRLDHQRMQVASRYDLHNKKLVRVIGEMERQCEQPLSSEALANKVIAHPYHAIKLTKMAVTKAQDLPLVQGLEIEGYFSRISHTRENYANFANNFLKERRERRAKKSKNG